MEDTSSVAGVLTANNTTVTMTATGSDSTTLSLDTSAPTSGAYYTIAATGTGGAKVTTGGYLPTNTEKTDSTTLNKYIKRATTSKTSGTASATANAGTASIKTQPSASASITKTGIDAGISSSATSYYVTATANSNSGVVTATGGSASASVTASSTTVGAGYNPSAVTTSTTASSTGTKTGNTATTTAATASKSETVYLKESNIGVATSKPSGYIENTTAVVPTSGYLKLDAGYMPATVISLATLVPNDADITNDVAGSNKIRTGTTVYDKDGNLVTGTMNDITPKYTVGNHAPVVGSSATVEKSSVQLTTLDVDDEENVVSPNGAYIKVVSSATATCGAVDILANNSAGYLHERTNEKVATLSSATKSVEESKYYKLSEITLNPDVTVIQGNREDGLTLDYCKFIVNAPHIEMKSSDTAISSSYTAMTVTTGNKKISDPDGSTVLPYCEIYDSDSNATLTVDKNYRGILDIDCDIIQEQTVTLKTSDESTYHAVVDENGWVTNTISPTNTNGATYYGKTIVNNVATSAFTIAPNKNTATVTVGTLSNGYYPLTNSMTASTNCTTAGWIAAGTKTGNSTSIQVGQIAAAGALTVTPAASNSTVTVGTLSNGYYPLTNTISASAAHASVGYVASTGSTSGSKSIKVGQIAAGTLGISSFNYSGSVQSQTFGSYDTTHSTIPLTLNISHNIQGTPSATAAGYIPKGNGTAVSATKSSTFSVTLDAWDGSYTIATVE